MSELTASKRNSLIAVVFILTAFMLGFHYETIVKGIFTDYSFEPLEGVNNHRLKEYVGSYHALR